jgi:serine/threonine protein kinase
MELVDGGDLAQLIHQKGKLSPAEALPILAQIASALDYAHANGAMSPGKMLPGIPLSAMAPSCTLPSGTRPSGARGGRIRVASSRGS